MTTLEQAKAPEKNADELTFPVTGMTCASCVRRIEKALGRVDGVVEANVNLATENAHVVFDPAVASMDKMQAAVEKAGYAIGSLPEPVEAEEDEPEREIDDLKRKWMVSLGIGVVMMALMYLPLNIPLDVLAPVLLIAATA